MPENRIFTLCRMITWVVFLRMFNTGKVKVKIVKNERDPPLFTSKLLMKFQNILRNTTQVIIRHRVKIIFSIISSPIILEWQKWKSSHFCHSRIIGLDMMENRIFTLCRMITWVVFLKMFWNLISSLPVKRGGSLSFLTIFTFAKHPIFRHIKSNNSGMAKVKIGKNERDPPLFTGKLLIKFQNILRNTTQVIIRHRVKILFSVISSPITLERQWTWYDGK
jgi:hypothetical protein